MGNIYQIRCCFSKLKSKTNYSYNYAKCKQNRFLSYRLCKGSSYVLVDSFDQTIWKMLHWNNVINVLLLALLTNLFTKNVEHYFRIQMISSRIFNKWATNGDILPLTFLCILNIIHFRMPKSQQNPIYFQVCDILSYSLILF